MIGFFTYAVKQDAHVLMVRNWPFNREWVAQDILFSRLSMPETWLQKALR